MKKARAMYIPAGGKKAVWGPVDHNVLPEGYPYKEVTVTDALTWDGVSDIVAGSDDGSNVQYGFVSAIMPTQEDLAKGGSIVVSNGHEETFDASTVYSYTDFLCVFVGSSPFVVVALADNCTLNDSIVFPKAGIYFVSGNGMHVASFSINGYRFETATIHPMAPEFLPAGVGGGVTLYGYFNEKLIKTIPENWHESFDFSAGGAPWVEELSVAEQIDLYNKAYKAFVAGKDVNLVMLSEGVFFFRAFMAIPALGDSTAKMTFSVYANSTAGDMSQIVALELTESGVKMTHSM